MRLHLQAFASMCTRNPDIFFCSGRHQPTAEIFNVYRQYLFVPERMVAQSASSHNQPASSAESPVDNVGSPAAVGPSMPSIGSQPVHQSSLHSLKPEIWAQPCYMKRLDCSVRAHHNTLVQMCLLYFLLHSGSGPRDTELERNIKFQYYHITV